MADEKIIDLPKEEPKAIEMIITLKPEGVEVKFPLIFDPMATYGALKMAEKALDIHYQNQRKSNIVKPRGIMDFVRK